MKSDPDDELMIAQLLRRIRTKSVCVCAVGVLIVRFVLLHTLLDAPSHRKQYDDRMKNSGKVLIQFVMKVIISNHDDSTKLQTLGNITQAIVLRLRSALSFISGFSQRASA